jgi:tRNA/rRNA methyltransferase
MAANLDRIEIVLVRPETPGNVGAACRAMRNFGLSRLCIVGSPGITEAGEARALAHACEDLLHSARRCDTLDQALSPHAMAVGTANRVRKGKLPPLEGPELVVPELLETTVGGSCAVVFGPESCGLTDCELARCARLLRIPTAVDYPSLNLSQAVLLVAQECWKRDGGVLVRDAQDAPEMPSNAEYELLLSLVESLMARAGFHPYAGDPETFRLAARRSLQRGRFERRDLRTLLTMAKSLDRLSRL